MGSPARDDSLDLYWRTLQARDVFCYLVKPTYFARRWRAVFFSCFDDSYLSFARPGARVILPRETDHISRRRRRAKIFIGFCFTRRRR